MKATYRNEYTSANGNLTAVYAVSGTQAEIEEFEATVPAEYLRHDDESGQPLFFSTNDFRKGTHKMSISRKGNVRLDNPLDSVTAMLGKVTNPALQQALATKLANEMFASLSGTSSVATPVAQQIAEPIAEPAPDEDISQM